METKQKAKGSWGVRFFIVILGIILGVLFYWMLNFIQSDIGKIRGPDWYIVREEFVSQELDDSHEQLKAEISDLNRKIETHKEQKWALSESTESLQKTMDQLLSIQQQYIEKGQEFPVESVKTLHDSQAAFVENQKQDQQYTKEISSLIQQRQQKEDAMSSVSKEIETYEDKAREKHEKLWEKHRLKVAILKFSFLIPIFLVVTFFFMKFRSGPYWAMVWSVFIATFIKISVVAHECFPTRYFKYIALLVTIGIVLRILIYLIRLIVAPKKDLLIKQYQQFYDKHLCPVCTKPIKAGPLRYTISKKKAVILSGQGAQIQKQENYTCPSCGTNLYDKCDKCGNIRHTLLPYCEHCGAKKED